MERYIKENIERLLYSSELTQSELAEKAGLSRQTVNKLLSSNTGYSPKLSTLVLVSNALLINFPELLIRTDKISTSKDFCRNSVEDYQNILTQNVKFYLRGWKQFSLSNPSGVRESTISNLINGKYSDIHFSTIESLAKKMEVPLADLFKRGEN
ncbi:helix-turn-helix transcriptional regulator [Streptococcus dysgalactiae subsp. equisimilis]|uniref:helix-turn-helix domain-containing protein n=1 Tax=Streptococcus TaxID=1301 RepID=UPI000A11CD68|nr:MULTISPECIES: helix-turn-helix transcriptional regulator [Streptococcus]MCY7196060.1 helix-turn-helix domain-containing protein [Streptococcus dysgalactiae]MCY7200531.1 helix-turn-helix domain-containing protein [Streptococcus dysgalactiae]MCY7205562.1 helix-turn-helix domain-containing protein [Streptococcus dysgalactiae]MCY7216207.1 helix-turn-helix domain-containing protein [Streptococcus dysgalactiae]ORJ91945.1 transcriptional regulator [Streptococcus dysgalactiae subsp. equisimilis]